MLVKERLKQAKKIIIGTKQTGKAIENKQAKVVFLAQDADARIIGPLIKICDEKGIEMIMVSSMVELGSACGIEVGSAAVAIIE